MQTQQVQKQNGNYANILAIFTVATLQIRETIIEIGRLEIMKSQGTRGAVIIRREKRQVVRV